MRFRLVPKPTTLVDPEMTLDGNYALRCITHMCFGANHKNLMKIDPYYQRQKCGPGILVSSKVSLMQIFAAEGASNEGGVVKNGDFRIFRSLYLPNLHI